MNSPKLGVHGAVLAAENKTAARAFAESIRPQVQQDWDDGHRTLRAMGAFLTAQGVETAAGGLGPSHG
jgi:hypothetical protein